MNESTVYFPHAVITRVPKTPSSRNPRDLAARREASARHCTKDLDKDREKARQRMSRIRAAAKQDRELMELRREQARTHAKTYRERNRESLAHQGRTARMDKYLDKHGEAAWIARDEWKEKRDKEERRREHKKKEGEVAHAQKEGETASEPGGFAT
ncbi:hypothetical protein C8J57DRAFT_1506098 [Mycena rebaudengoi]|nr:hypothetical protein C8J57DRAFT_1506098 [Mycena rebaudengoi]